MLSLYAFLTPKLVRALCDAGMDAVDARDLIGYVAPGRGTIDGVARGRCVVAWDVDVMDARRFPVRDDRSILVLRFQSQDPVIDLVPRMVRTVRSFKDQRPPGAVIVVLESRGSAVAATMPSGEMPEAAA